VRRSSGHALLAVTWLRQLGPATDDWLDRFNDMVDFAASKKWLQEGALLAHIDRP
jgi:hypothetical protein